MKVICDLCGKVIDKKGLSRHKITVHEKKKDFVCSICNMGFGVKYKLDYHMVKHSDVRKYPCAVYGCGSAFKTRSDMLQHEKKHSNGLFNCVECTMPFLTRLELDKHIKESHQKKTSNKIFESLSCPLCNKKFSRKDCAKRHYDNVHVRGQSAEFACNNCEEIFKNHAELSLHIRESHPMVSCLICKKGFLRKDHLIRHMATVHSESRDFICKFCNRTFKIKQDLKTHIRYSHEIEKKKCNECDYRYEKPYKLLKHRLKMHGLGIFQCDYCGSQFNRKNQLKNHMLKHAKGSKIFKCECLKIFYSKSGLNRHIKRHENEKEAAKEINEETPFKNNPSDSDCVKEEYTIDPGEIKQEENYSEDKFHSIVMIPDVREIKYEEFIDESCIKQENSALRRDTEAQNQELHDIQSESDNEYQNEESNDIESEKEPSVSLGKKNTLKPNKSLFKCQLCPNEYQVKSSYNHHMRKKHPDEKITSENDKNFKRTNDTSNTQCEYCPKNFLTRSKYLYHRRQQHALESGLLNRVKRTVIRVTGLLECDYCGKKVSKKQFMIVHFRRHITSLRPTFVCQICGKVFRHSASYYLHMNKHNSKNPFKCKYCDCDGFPGLMYLQNHVYSKHREYSPHAHLIPCKICGKMFTKLYMNTHMKLHLGAYKCRICGRHCASKGSLKNHLTTHNKGEVITCGSCDKTFSSVILLKQHIKKHHPDMGVIEDLSDL